MIIGTLYIVSTPIGNLEDFTYRAHRILQEVSVIAAEDTRHTQKLCTHYGIHTLLTSYHDFNKEEKTPVLLQRILEGQSLALVSDAGTPLISDPGYYLVTRAIEKGVPVVPIPGPSAVLAALTISGMPTDAFRFEGFLPRKQAAKTRLLQELIDEPRTTILFETPHRIMKTLRLIHDILGERRIALTRELTKTHEETLRGHAETIMQACQKRAMKGEMTLVVEGKKKTKRKKQLEQEADYSSLF